MRLRVILRPALAGVLALAAATCVNPLVGSDPPTTPTAIFDLIWKDFDRNYAFFAVKGIDWNDSYRRYKPRADTARSALGVAAVIGSMLAELQDGHVDLVVSPGLVYHSYNAAGKHTWFNSTTAATYLSGTKISPSRTMQYGTFTGAPDVGYVWVSTFANGNWGDQIDDVLASFGSARAVVIDVRNNGGGNSGNGVAIAGRLTDVERTFGYIAFRNGPAHSDFSDEREMRVPVAGRRFTGRVVVLMNRFCASATEDFVLAMRAVGGVTFVGDTTSGNIGHPFYRDLPNGWSYRLPQGIEFDTDHVGYEAIGIPPTVYVGMTAADSAARRDLQLERALAIARAP